ncbi:MAG TPA: hypothetical protein HPP83_09805, partial [Candidatus Hydrogenedentes bacterium]|nr:hypothetical protein [Candidatus Hydrogenedentota bacterium]
HRNTGSSSLVRRYFVGGDLARNLVSLDLNVTVPELLLTKCDRIAAAHGVTLEFPYLSAPLVDFVARLSPKVKYGVRSKPLLRLAVKGIVPAPVRLRARRGFRIPQSGRVVRVIENAARQTITQERVEASGLFKWQHVDKIMQSATHNVYRRRQFWALFMFFAWYRAFMES